MKIAFVSHRYMPYKGGIETLVQAIGERLAASGHQIEVLTLTTSALLPAKQEFNGVTIRRFREWVPGDEYYAGMALLPYLLLHGKDHDIINAHNYHSMPLLWAGVACHARLVASTHYHGHGHTVLTNWIHPLYRPFGRWAVQRAQRVICASDHERNLVRAHFRVAEDKLDIVPDGIPLAALQSAQPFDLPGTSLLYVGRLERYKRVDLAIDALAYLPEDHCLYVIGKGPDEPLLRQCAQRAQVAERVIFMKNVPNEDLFRWYRSAQALIMMSEAESFPMTSLEAMAAGCRVVCGSRPPFTELAARFPDAVYPAQVSSPRAVADRIRTATQTPGRIEANLSEYDWDSVARATLMVFEKVVSSYGIASGRLTHNLLPGNRRRTDQEIPL